MTNQTRRIARQNAEDLFTMFSRAKLLNTPPRRQPRDYGRSHYSSAEYSTTRVNCSSTCGKEAGCLNHAAELPRKFRKQAVTKQELDRSRSLPGTQFRAVQPRFHISRDQGRGYATRSRGGGTGSIDSMPVKLLSTSIRHQNGRNNGASKGHACR